MTRHQHHLLRSIADRLRPSPKSLAAAAALYDSGPLLYLEAAQQPEPTASPFPA